MDAMRVSDKLALVDKIGRELQSRYTFGEIDAYLAEFGISTPKEYTGPNSKWVYSREALNGAPTSAIAKIAEDLNLEVVQGIVGSSTPPKIWSATGYFRLFISHISADKRNAHRLKESLAPLGISGFVAHDDINPTLEWQVEIERALQCMDAFVAIHTPGFSNSFWTQQEVGFALGRGAKIISFEMGELPTGFVGKHQALRRQGRNAEQIAKEIDKILNGDEKTSQRLLQAKVNLGIVDPEGDDEIPF